MRGKQNLASALGIQKENLRVTVHFSEIIKVQFGKKKRHTLLCFVLFFRIIVAYLSLKNVWLPPIFFLDFNGPCGDLLSPHSNKLCKNTSLLGGTVLNSGKNASAHPADTTSVESSAREH